MKVTPEAVCTMRVVKGALTVSPETLPFEQRILHELEDGNCGSLIEFTLPFGKLAKIQRVMVKHYKTPVPWYMDGWLQHDKNTIICAFGADDGENGKIFVFERNDKQAFATIKAYAISKGIPEEQVDFLEA